MAESRHFKQIEALKENEWELKVKIWQKGVTLCTLIFEVQKKVETRFELEKRVKMKVP